MRATSFILLVCAVCSCAFFDKGVIAYQELIDEKYQRQNFWLNIAHEGYTATFKSVHFLKIDERDGMLVVCGARIYSIVPGMARWYTAAEVYVKHPENTVASARLLRVIDPKAARSEWKANCIKTDAPKLSDSEIRNSGIGLTGPRYM